MTPTSQIKTRDRVRDHAEVFTAPREVNAMLDLADQAGRAFDRIDRTFLEPACGNGAFLVEILRRKLLLAEHPVDVLRALTSIYGVDIQTDNAEESRYALLRIAISRLLELAPARGVSVGQLTRDALAILDANIIVGDFLTGVAGTEWVWKHGPNGWVCSTKPATISPTPTGKRPTPNPVMADGAEQLSLFG